MMFQTNNTPINIADVYNVKDAIWVDVRCPREYSKGHFPDSINIPLFSDYQHEDIGKTYKKSGQEVAIELGLEHAETSKNSILEKLLSLKSKKN